MNRFKDGLIFGFDFSISALVVFGLAWIIYTNIQDRIFEHQLQQMTQNLKHQTQSLLSETPQIPQRNQQNPIATITSKNPRENHLSPKQQKECSLLIMQYGENDDPAIKDKIDRLCN